MITVEVHVTSEHIAAAWPGACPVILALLDALPGVKDACLIPSAVEGSDARLTLWRRPWPRWSRGVVVELPVEVAELADLFRWDQPVHPAVFTVQVPRVAVTG